jgi:hypothetical protein
VLAESCEAAILKSAEFAICDDGAVLVTVGFDAFYNPMTRSEIYIP